jgi:hypothetical protein
VYITWADDRHGYTKIYFKNSSDNGIYWSEDFQLTHASSNSYAPDIAVSNNNLHVLWTDDMHWAGATNELYYKRYYPP